MKTSDVERWTARVLNEIERGIRREDDRVEVKRKPPSEVLKTARRIAGHAKQVRSGQILWLLGLDETTEGPVIGADRTQPRSRQRPTDDRDRPLPEYRGAEDRELGSVHASHGLGTSD